MREALVFGERPAAASPNPPGRGPGGEHDGAAFELFTPTKVASRRSDPMASMAPPHRYQVILAALLRRISEINPVLDGHFMLKVDNKEFLESAKAAPYKVSDLEKDLDHLELLSDLRPERASEILDQIGFVPAYWANIVPISPLRTPFTLELMHVLVSFAAFVVQDCKRVANRPRPNEYSPRIQPMIETPGHGAFPGGHAAECRLVSALLYKLIAPRAGSLQTENDKDPNLEQVRAMLLGLSDRIAENREVAGLHFASDTEAGNALADYLFKHVVAPELDPTQASGSDPPPPPPPPPFKWLCEKAMSEWRKP